ncbi:MAG: DNA polymerase III subunit [Ruminococcaceae bacterium]|nr:DNA polymerase III subunit [Oscillospiraceae bacterium]
MNFPLVGNKRICETIDALISSNRLPHAIIIEGEKGTGKRTLAKYIAKAAVCESSVPPCNSCRNCHLADANTHPDIETVAPEPKRKNIVVEQVRNLRSTAYRSAHTASRRAFIIEQADTMNPSSQNSLLKVLEDPPSDVVFVLIALSADNLLETVVSRCLILSLNTPSQDEAVKYLTSYHKMSEDKARTLLTEEKNNIGKVLKRKKGTKESAGKTAAVNFFNAVESGETLSALLFTAPLEKDRVETEKFTEELCEILLSKIKDCRHLSNTAREYTDMYRVVCDLKPTLITNINLSLYFTALVSKLSAVKNKS